MTRNEVLNQLRLTVKDELDVQLIYEDIRANMRMNSLALKNITNIERNGNTLIIRAMWNESKNEWMSSWVEAPFMMAITEFYK